MAQKKILTLITDFLYRNKEGMIVGMIIGGLVSMFTPLFLLATLLFQWFLPIFDYMHNQTAFKIMLVVVGMVIGALIDQLIAPEK